MNKNWSNTALVAYSLLPKIANELNKAVENRIKRSFMSRHLKMGISTENLIGEIIDLVEEKRKIVNLRFIVKTALDGIKHEYRQMLIDRIINKKTFQEIANDTGQSIRTVFRKVAVAEQDFQLNLRKAGYTEHWFEEEYGKDKYISPIYKRIINDKYFVAKNL